MIKTKLYQLNLTELEVQLLPAMLLIVRDAPGDKALGLLQIRVLQLNYKRDGITRAMASILKKSALLLDAYSKQEDETIRTG